MRQCVFWKHREDEVELQMDVMHVVGVEGCLCQPESGSRICVPERCERNLWGLLVLLKLLGRLPPQETRRQLQLMKLWLWKRQPVVRGHWWETILALRGWLIVIH